jgi:MFS family permease
MAATADYAWALVLLLGASSATQAPFDPASASAIPQVVPERDVPRANSLVAASSSAAYLAGPLLGGALLGLGASPAAVFVADAATFLVSALLVWSVRRPFGRGSTAEHPGLLAGARVIARERALLVPVIAGMLSLVGVGIVNVASYPLSLDLGGGATGFGAMTGLLGGGGLLGAALAARALRAGPVRVLTVAFAVGGAGIAIAAGAPVLAVCLAGMAVAGAGNGVGEVAQTTLIQSRSADAVRSRVFGAQDGAAHIAFSVSAFSGGLLVELVGARGAFGVAAAFGLGAAVVAAAASPRRRASRSSREP